MFTYFISILLFAGLTAWGFFNPTKASIWFLGFTACFAVWLIYLSILARTKSVYLNLNSFTPIEHATFRRYAFYFTFSHHAMVCSSTCHVISIFALIWVPWLLWCNEWILASYFVAVFISTSFAAPFINPGTYIRFYATRDKRPHDFEERFAALQAVEEKIRIARGIF